MKVITSTITSHGNQVTNRMKIVHITSHHLFLGGGERLGFNWVANSKHASLFYSRKGGIEYTKSKRFKTYSDDTDLGRVIARHKDDVIVVHDPFLAGSQTLKYCSHLVWYVHGAFAFKLDVSDLHPPKLAISNYSPETLHPSWVKIPVIPIHLGIDDTRFTPPKTFIHRPRIIVGIVGRIAEEKIPLYLFDFIRKFNRLHGSRFEFHFYGKGVDGSHFTEQFLSAINSIHNCHYKGSVSKDEMGGVYHRLDILIVPSLSETGSYAIVEAQASGLRVLCLANDGMPNHVNGSSTLCRNYDEIFSELGAVLQPDNIKARAEQSRITLERHDLNTWVWKLDKVAEIANLM